MYRCDVSYAVEVFCIRRCLPQGLYLALLEIELIWIASSNEANLKEKTISPQW